MSKIDEKALEGMVRKVLTDIFSKNVDCCNETKHIDKSGILSVRVPEIRPDPFDTGKKGDKVLLKDLVTLQESPRLAFGVMEMDATDFEWTLNYDEVDYIIEGTLEIIVDGRKVIGNKGDAIFIPKGSPIHFSAPKFARFLYVTYPADWANQK